MKVVITNTAMSNGGDAAICLAIVDMVHRVLGSDTKITLVDPLADVARRYYPEFEILQAAHFVPSRKFKGRWRKVGRLIDKLRPWRMRGANLLKAALGPSLSDWLLGPLELKAVRAYREADLVISTGGTYLVDHYDISPRLFELQLALYADKRPIFYVQSLGPFARPGLAESVRLYFDQAPSIMLRDEKSRGYLQNLGIDKKKLHVLADCVFGLAPEQTLRAAMTAETAVRRVAISVRPWSFPGRDREASMNDYMDGVTRLAQWLYKTYDCEILFVSTCQGIPQYLDDSAVADDIAKRLSGIVPADKLHVDRAFHDPRDLQKILAAMDLVVATRMHMAILSLCAGVPVLPIAYEFKTTELFTRLGTGKWVAQIQDVKGESLIEMARDFLRELPAIRQSLFEGVERERELALSAEPLVRDALAKADLRRAERPAGRV
jgi:colanic acid/amylovoran biosynthesis protein